jgi:hypothetical protein
VQWGGGRGGWGLGVTLGEGGGGKGEGGAITMCSTASFGGIPGVCWPLDTVCVGGSEGRGWKGQGGGSGGGRGV